MKKLISIKDIEDQVYCLLWIPYKIIVIRTVMAVIYFNEVSIIPKKMLVWSD